MCAADNHTKVNDVLCKDSQYLQQQREYLQKQLDEAKEQLRQKKLEEKQQLKLLRDEVRWWCVGVGVGVGGIDDANVQLKSV